MPIKLDTPFTYTPGHGEVSYTYTQIKVVRFSVDIDAKQVVIVTQYGDTNAGIWTPGIAPTRSFVIENREAHLAPPPEGQTYPVQIPQDPAYDDLMTGYYTQLPTGSSVYDEVGISLYTYLLNNGYYTGTLEV